MVLGTRYWAGPPEKLNGKSHTAVVLGASRPAGPIRCPGVGSYAASQGDATTTGWLWRPTWKAQPFPVGTEASRNVLALKARLVIATACSQSGRA